MNCFQDLLDNSSVIKLCLLTRALNIFINSGREAADIPLSAEDFTIMLCDLQRSWMKEEIKRSWSEGARNVGADLCFALYVEAVLSCVTVALQM